MLFQLLTNDTADNSDLNNRSSISTRGGISETSSHENSSKSIITKIPSMSEINYINYITAARVGMAEKDKTFTNISQKSTIFAGLPSALGTNDTAYMVSTSKEDPNDLSALSLYDTLDRYYQIRTFLTDSKKLK